MDHRIDRGDSRSDCARRRPPNRRRCETVKLVVGNMRVSATVGFYPDGRPAEIFMNSGKAGSATDALLGDPAVVISVALQYGIPPSALAKSAGRVPEQLDGPATAAASAIGAALDILAGCERSL